MVSDMNKQKKCLTLLKALPNSMIVPRRNDMFKLLQIRVDGFKKLPKNYSLSFITRAKVLEEDFEEEVLKLDDGLNTCRSFAFCGPNASGKSTILSLLVTTYLLLETGRVYSNEYFFNQKPYFDLEIDFYFNGKIFFYSARFEKQHSLLSTVTPQYCTIHNEKLIELVYEKRRGRKILEDKDKGIIVPESVFPTARGDTSFLPNFLNAGMFLGYFADNNVLTYETPLIRRSFFDLFKKFDQKLITKVIQLFDANIEEIHDNGDGRFKFKWCNQPPRLVDETYSAPGLSRGTVRGIELVVNVILVLEKGGVLIVDEIENSFHKNLVHNLLMLFNDSQMNPYGAQLFFSTHYVEVLDLFKRQDSIFITQKDGEYILSKNLKDFHIRSELLKSKQFDQNCFNNLISYQKLMDAREAIRDAVSAYNDRR